MDKNDSKRSTNLEKLDSCPLEKPPGIVGVSQDLIGYDGFRVPLPQSANSTYLFHLAFIGR